MTTVYLPAKRNKYRNVRTTVDGIAFASKKEAARYQELKLLDKCGAIAELSRQVVFNFAVGRVHICKYVADFTYYDQKRNFIVEDVKGKRTREYVIKRNLMLAIRGIEIKET